ncbi:CHAT domain-containing protein [Streptomyces griseorubiginosus]|uniref:CHAT domain-containing protein n=1 Tax=Streptomyces griseorubiginosus TaxID=67304 RepID=UPI001AD69E7C|nr:CHAT domain-containing protein [Streptomyces griseorubiginosus]MBO4252824.1 CHAT domain-containing protein [Streptomyces griseorubiginosus]
MTSALRYAAADAVPVAVFVGAGLGWLAAAQDPGAGGARWQDAPLGWLTDLLPAGSTSVLVAAVVLMTLLRLGTRLDGESPPLLLLQKVFLGVMTLAAGVWAVHDGPGGTSLRYGPLTAAVLLAMFVRRVRGRGTLSWRRRRTAAGFGPSSRALLGLRPYIALRNLITAYPQSTLFSTDLAETQAQESAAVFRDRGDAVSEAFCWALGIDYMIAQNKLPYAERLVRAMRGSPEAARQPAALAAEAGLLRAVGESERSLAELRKAAAVAGRVPAALRGLIAEAALEVAAYPVVPHGSGRRAALVWRQEFGAVLLDLVVEARALAAKDPDRALALAYRVCRLPDRVAPLSRGGDPDAQLRSYLQGRTATGSALMLAAEIHESRGHHGAATGAYLDALSAFEATVERTRAARCVVLGFLNAVQAGYDDPDQEEQALDMIRVGLQMLESDRGALRGEEHRSAWLGAQEELYARVFTFVSSEGHAHSGKAAELGLWLLESLHRTLTEALIGADDGPWFQTEDTRLQRLTRLEATARARTAEEFAAVQERLGAVGARGHLLDRLADARRGDDPLPSPSSATADDTVGGTAGGAREPAAMTTNGERPGPEGADAAQDESAISATTDVQDLLDRLGDRVALLYHCRRDTRGWSVLSAMVSAADGTRLHRTRLDTMASEVIADTFTPVGALDALAAADEAQTTMLYYTPLDDPVWAQLSQALVPAQWWDLLCPESGRTPREVVVVPDGPLSAVPFAALPVRDRRPLLEYALITLTPALSMLRPPTARHTGSHTAGRPAVVSHIGVGLPPESTAAEVATLERIAASATVRRTADRTQLEAALHARPAADLAVISAHGSAGAAADRSLWLADGSALSAASAALLPWPSTVVLGSCWVSGMIVDAGREPFGFPLACFLGGAHTVVGGAAPVPDEAAGADVRRLIESVPHGRAPLSVLREAALERVREVPLSELDAATTTGLITWSTASSSRRPRLRPPTPVFWDGGGLSIEDVTSQGHLSLRLPPPVRAVLDVAAQTSGGQPIGTMGFAVAAFGSDPGNWQPLPGRPAGGLRDEAPEGRSDRVLLSAPPGQRPHQISTSLARALRRGARLADGAHRTAPLHVIAAALLDDESAVARWVRECGARGEQWADRTCFTPLGGEPGPDALLGTTPGDWERHRSGIDGADLRRDDGAVDRYDWPVAFLVGLLIVGVPALLGAPNAPATSHRPANPTTVTVTYAPADDARSTDVDQAVTRLRERAAESGIKGAEFTATDDRITATAPARYRERLVALAKGESGAEIRPVLQLRTATTSSPSPLGAESTGLPQAGDDPAATALEERFEATDCPTDTVAMQEAVPSEPVVLCDAHDPITYLLGAAALTGNDVTKAEASYAADRGWSVSLSFSSAGGKRFAQLTGRLATFPPPQNQLAITAGGRVVSAPSVQQSLTGRGVEIYGSFDKRQAADLATELTGRTLYRVVEVTSR